LLRLNKGLYSLGNSTGFSFSTLSVLYVVPNIEFNSEYLLPSTLIALNKEDKDLPLASHAQQCQGFSFLVVGIKLTSNFGFLWLQTGQWKA
jgi:hypothetical protein